MLCLAPGHAGAAETWPRGIELFVVEGEVVIDGTAHRAGTWLRLSPGSSLTLASEGGALLYRKTGHLC
nr:cupin domain-containing protein [Acidiphilium sp.]